MEILAKDVSVNQLLLVYDIFEGQVTTASLANFSPIQLREKTIVEESIKKILTDFKEQNGTLSTAHAILIGGKKNEMLRGFQRDLIIQSINKVDSRIRISEPSNLWMTKPYSCINFSIQKNGFKWCKSEQNNPNSPRVYSPKIIYSLDENNSFLSEMNKKYLSVKADLNIETALMYQLSEQLEKERSSKMVKNLTSKKIQIDIQIKIDKKETKKESVIKTV